jgi:hypothetical protein
MKYNPPDAAVCRDLFYKIGMALLLSGCENIPKAAAVSAIELHQAALGSSFVHNPIEAASIANLK